MKSQRSRGLWMAALFLAAPALVLMIGQSQRVAADEEAEGRIVEISPSEDADLPEADRDSDEQQAEVKMVKHWIGVQGGPINSRVLRTHLQLADDVGVVVENVVPDSPAEKAGIRQHDILAAVNGEPIANMIALQKVVAESGDKPIELKLIRLAKEMTVTVKPEALPKDQWRPLASEEAQQQLGGPMDVEGILKQFQEGGPGFRMIGPGTVLRGQAFDLSQMPHGISVSITREGDAPPKITVKKGEDTWTVEGDDKEALKQLPKDVRPFVEKLLQAPPAPRQLGANFNFGGELEKLLPGELGRFEFEGAFDNEALRGRAEAVRRRTEEASQRLQKQLEDMQQQLEELQRRMEENAPADRTNRADDPSKT